MPQLTGKEVETTLGRLILSEEAIATIAGAAATECYGVVGMAGRRMVDGIMNFSAKRTYPRASRCQLRAIWSTSTWRWL